MKKHNRLGIIGIGAFILAGVLLSFITDSFAADAVIVQVYQSGEGDQAKYILNPPELYITKNTVVIWMNGVTGPGLQVVFEEGKACKDVSLSPKNSGFMLNAKSCYVTTFMSYAGTSSLKFTDTGTFAYKILSEDGKLNIQGKIIVRDI